MKRIFTIVFFNFLTVAVFSQTISSFKAFKNMPKDTFWNGSDLLGGFVDGAIDFPCVYDTSWGGFWSGGWAVSTMRDDSTSGADNLYGIVTHSRIDESPFAIAQNHADLKFVADISAFFQGFYITNTTYAYLSMKNGDSFAKKFGGNDGTDKDFFKLRIYAIQDSKVDSSNYVDFYLADYRFDNDSLDYIVRDWWYVDLSPLGYVEGLNFELTSSDNGPWGMNTPAFFAVDKIKYSYKPGLSNSYHVSYEQNKIPIDSFWNGKDEDPVFYDSGFKFPCVFDTAYGGYWKSGFALSTMRDDITEGSSNLYSAIPGGAYDGITYAISQNNTSFHSRWADAYPVIKSIKITNTTYAYYSMKNGDAFAKKFGGESGNDPDFFKLRIYPLELIDFGVIDSSRYYDVYLADYRFDDNSKDYILDDWVNINIDSIFDFEVSELAFELSSSDNGTWGMNTPAFFAIDDIDFDLLSSVEDVNNNSLIVYPNPATNYIKISIENLLNNPVYEIYGMNGILFSKGTLLNDAINVSALKKGCYIIRILSNEGDYITKFDKL